MTATIEIPAGAGVAAAGAAGGPVLELRGVTKRYPGPPPLVVLRDVDLTVRAGEMLAITGPSGSGKSTLLHLMGTLDRPSSGTVLVGGGEVSGLSDRQLAALRARQIGLVFQQFYLLEGSARWTTSPWACCMAASRGGSAGGWPPWRCGVWGWATGCGTGPPSCRAGSSSGSRSRGRWSAAHRWCWPMSRPGTWTRPPASRSWRYWRS
jgi:hypothetical protein